MDYMLSLKTKNPPKDVDFTLLKAKGKAFRSAGHVVENKKENGLDIWLCGSLDLVDFINCVEVALDELIRLNFAEKLTGYFCMGLFMDSAARVHVVEFSGSIIQSLAKIGLSLKISYYPTE